MGPLSGRLAATYGYRRVLRVGMIGAVVSLGVMLLVVGSNSRLLLLVASILIGLTYAGTGNIILNGLGIVLSPKENPGFLPGLNAGAFNLGRRTELRRDLRGEDGPDPGRRQWYGRLPRRPACWSGDSGGGVRRVLPDPEAAGRRDGCSAGEGCGRSLTWLDTLTDSTAPSGDLVMSEGSATMRAWLMNIRA